MIKHTSIYALALLACLAATDASAQRMHDYSLSEKESLKVRSSNGGTSGNYQQFMNNDTDGYNQQQQMNGPSFNLGNSLRGSNYNTQLPNQPSSQFMVGYCDENFQPMLSKSGRIASLNACLSEQKKQACDMFQRLPVDAQRVMDSAINCVYTLANEGQMNNPGYMQQQPLPNNMDCSNGDSLRMNLLKQYWRDQNVSYAIVFLPDMVLDGPSRCMGGGY
jgi:hypothetical protein